MSAFSTKNITRNQAEEMVRAVRRKIKPLDEVSNLTIEELDEELHTYVYSEKYQDILGVLYNYVILD